MEYDEDEAVGRPQEYKPFDISKDKNIGASSHCKGGLLAFSFHVKAIDQIKCYIFWYDVILIFHDTGVIHLFINTKGVVK